MSERGDPLPEVPGDLIVLRLLEEIEEEEALGRLLGVDLAPPDPLPSHAPASYGPLESWLERALEVHAFLERRRLAERPEGA